MSQKNNVDNKLAALEILSSSIVGREMSVKYLSSSMKLAYTDCTTIFIRPGCDVESQRLEVLSQTLLIKLGTFQERCLHKLIGKSKLQNRFLVVELMRGYRSFYDQLPRLLLTALHPFVFNQHSKSAEESLRIAQSFCRIPDGPTWFGSIRPFNLLLRSTSSSSKPINNEELVELQSKAKAINKDGNNDDMENTYKDKLWEYLSSPQGKDGMFSKALRDILDMSSSPEPNGQEGTATTSTELVKSKKVNYLKDLFSAIRSKLSLETEQDSNESAFGSYPEWDYKKQIYKDSWVTAEEVEPYTPDFLLDDLIFENRHFYSFHKALSKLRLTLNKRRGESQGNDMDLDRVVQFRLDTLTGQMDEPLVYTDLHRLNRNMSVQILMDVSSSTLESTNDNKTIASLHINLARLLCQSFIALGDRVALHGFHSWGRQLLKMQRINGFGGSSITKVDQRMKQLSIAGYTRVGAAVRFGIKQLDENLSTTKKLLFVLSDGYPYDDHYEGKYALQDTKKALEEARSKGIACLSLAVGSDVNHVHLKEVYGDTNFLSVDKVEKIPAKLTSLIANALHQIK